MSKAASIPSAVRRPLSFERGSLVLFASLAVLIVGLVSLDTGLTGVGLFILGGLLGVVFLLFQYGFASVWRHALVRGEVMGLAAHFLLIGLCAIVFIPASALGLSSAGTVAPVTISLFVGAFIFGLGMQLGEFGVLQFVPRDDPHVAPVLLERLSDRPHGVHVELLEERRQRGVALPPEVDLCQGPLPCGRLLRLQPDGGGQRLRPLQDRRLQLRQHVVVLSGLRKLLRRERRDVEVYAAAQLLQHVLHLAGELLDAGQHLRVRQLRRAPLEAFPPRRRACPPRARARGTTRRRRRRPSWQTAKNEASASARPSSSS